MTTNNMRVSMSRLIANNGVRSTIMRNEIPKLIASCSRVSSDRMRVAMAKPGMNARASIISMYHQYISVFNMNTISEVGVRCIKVRWSLFEV